MCRKYIDAIVAREMFFLIFSVHTTSAPRETELRIQADSLTVPFPSVDSGRTYPAAAVSMICTLMP